MNIDDRVFEVSKHGASRMLFNNQWIAREAPKRGLRDPWAHSPHRLLHTEEILAKIAGVEVPATKSIYHECSDEELAAWKVERDEYIRQRDEWIALQMFHKYGYETFIEECEAYRLTDEFRNSVLPCESRSESQCNLFCAFYEDCALRLAETQNGG